MEALAAHLNLPNVMQLKLNFASQDHRMDH
jgi:hypothetical protein